MRGLDAACPMLSARMGRIQKPRLDRAMGSRLALLCVGVALSSCATDRVRVEAKGAAPDLRAHPSFELGLNGADNPSPEDQALAALVEGRLRDNGMISASGSGAQYRVEVIYTERPTYVGDYVASGDLNTRAHDGQWLTPPVRPGFWRSSSAPVCTLAVRLSVPTTGEELYRVRAVVRSPRRSCASMAPELAEAALREMSVAPAGSAFTR